MCQSKQISSALAFLFGESLGTLTLILTLTGLLSLFLNYCLKFRRRLNSSSFEYSGNYNSFCFPLFLLTCSHNLDHETEDLCFNFNFEVENPILKYSTTFHGMRRCKRETRDVKTLPRAL